MKYFRNKSNRIYPREEQDNIPRMLYCWVKMEYVAGRFDVLADMGIPRGFSYNLKSCLGNIAGLINKRNENCLIHIKFLQHRDVLAIDLGKKIRLTEDIAREYFRYDFFTVSNDVEKQGQGNTEHLMIMCHFRLYKMRLTRRKI